MALSRGRAPARASADDTAPAAPRTRLPAVDAVLAWPEVAALVAPLGRAPVLQAVRAELAAQRAELSAQPAVGQVPGRAALTAAVVARAQALAAPRLRRVFNLSGTVLHTNLGRAPLPQQALEAIADTAGGATNLEFDLATGQRGEREHAVLPLLRELTGAEAATVVNNTAAALMLVLATLAARREVIVSRGELIEIGGAFRLPDIMRQAGCRLREVGTTNRTHLQDHAEAIGPRTALLLKVHTSNFQIQGFSAAADERELAALARAHGLPLVVDLGSGALLDLARLGLPHEPTPTEQLKAGADLVLFSGDKLLGGPQAGIVVGRADLVARLNKNPLKRALRCDKLTLAALEAVLRLYARHAADAEPSALVAQLPALRLLARPAPEIDAMAQRLLPSLRDWVAAQGLGGEATVCPVFSQIGSGALPVDLLPSHALCLRPGGPQRGQGAVLAAWSQRLRDLPQPVVGRVAERALWLDLRCLEDEAGFAAQLQAAAASALSASPAATAPGP